MRPFYDGNGRKCKTLFANDSKISVAIRQKFKKPNNVKWIVIVLNAWCLRK